MPLTEEVAEAWQRRHPVLAAKARTRTFAKGDPEFDIWDRVIRAAECCVACGRPLERDDSRTLGLGRKCARKLRRALDDLEAS